MELLEICGLTDASWRDVIVPKSVEFRYYNRMSNGEKLEWSSDKLYVDASLFTRFVEFVENKKIDLTTNNPHAFDASRSLKRHPRIDYESRVFCWDLVLDCDTTRSKLCGIDNKLRAVEMEAGGFLRSLELFSKKMEYTISGLIFRGLSDQASNKTSTDEETTVKWREFAARNAATVMVEFIDDLREKDFAVGLERQAEPPAKTYAVAPGEIRTL